MPRHALFFLRPRYTWCYSNEDFVGRLAVIGMSAFVSTIPGGPLEQSAALPVQIYLWQGNELRNFFEGRTAAAIIVLLALMLSMNALAIWLRKRFETRW